MLRGIRKRLLGRGGVVALALALILAAGLASAPAAMAVPYQVCNNYATQLCFNVRGGSHTLNTPITAYTKNDSNATFEYWWLTSACGNGQVKVYSGGGCPFYAGSGLNSKYDGAAIVALRDYGSSGRWLCAGTDSSGTGNMLEQPCPTSLDGTGGGGHGVLWVLKA
jgi:hypothetical protein